MAHAFTDSGVNLVSGTDTYWQNATNPSTTANNAGLGSGYATKFSANDELIFRVYPNGSGGTTGMNWDEGVGISYPGTDLDGNEDIYEDESLIHKWFDKIVRFIVL